MQRRDEQVALRHAVGQRSAAAIRIGSTSRLPAMKRPA